MQCLQICMKSNARSKKLVQQVASVCHLSNRAFSKDRDRLLVTRSAIFDLVQALKFKISLPDANFLLLTSLVLQDAGGSIQVI